MKIACNYYPEVLELIDDGKIDIDYVKFPSVPFQLKVFEDKDLIEFKEIMSKINSRKRVLLDGLNPAPHNIGSSTFIKDFDLNAAIKVMEVSKSPGISLHLAGINQEMSDEENLSIILRNIRHLKNDFSDIAFISFENVPSLNSGICANPKFISDVIYQSGANFLLDISHAYCAAKELNMDFEEYLNRLPLDKVYEIHINGWVEKGSKIMCHTKINEHGYEIISKLLDVCSPEIITIEYGRDIDNIDAGIPLIYENQINDKVKEEIIEQVLRIRELIL